MYLTYNKPSRIVTCYYQYYHKTLNKYVQFNLPLVIQKVLEPLVGFQNIVVCVNYHSIGLWAVEDYAILTQLCLPSDLPDDAFKRINIDSSLVSYHLKIEENSSYFHFLHVE